ncbi:carbon monoxide dehydrogenase subunit G [Nocardioides sp. SR21]|uniref:SRPBCC family protein n=1 Tax=Nocardioides sp. SR21 TaxID=2919501 RepID=UPI001FAAFC9F|nr:carbon monoxide dehydrogenase subunit G [Nocardioides sp. SR21]
MNIVGSNIVPFPVEMVWEAILDPRVLVATIPGCDRLVATGENSYDMTVTAGVAAIKGTYLGSCTLSDLQQHQSLVMKLTGAGAPGTIDATVKVFFGEAEPGVTRIDYDADAVVGGMVGGVGQRMLTSVSKRMAGDFFDNVAQAIGQGPDPSGSAVEPAATAAGDAPAARTFTAPARPAVGSQSDFVKGIAVGAGLVVLGVVVGRLFGRR